MSLNDKNDHKKIHSICKKICKLKPNNIKKINSMGFLIKNKIYTVTYDAFKRYKNRGRMIHCGTLNPDKTFYIIRRCPTDNSGLFSNFEYVFGHIIYAKKKGYIPVIDMENYKTIYNEPRKINNTRNAWEYYFNQPTNFTLEEAYKSKNVRLSSYRYLSDEYNIDIPNYLANRELLKKHYRIINKYMPINDTVNKYIENCQETKIICENDTIGVLLRETDLVSLKIKGHPIMPSADALIKKTWEFIEKWDAKYVYFVNETTSTLEVFKEEFGEMLIYPTQDRISHYDGRSLIADAFKKEHVARYLKGLQYLSAIVLLAKCKYLIFPDTNGTLGAVQLNGGNYKDIYYFNLGLYR